MKGTRYIGDLSRADMQVLAEYAMTHRRVLEFGAGASTQILALRGDQNAAFYCVETEQSWIDRTSDNCRRLGARHPIYLSWLGWQQLQAQEFDLVFNDGLLELRDEFASRAWRMLGEGGSLLWHDCRAATSSRDIVTFVGENYAEIESVSLSYRESNIAVIRKRVAIREGNWHEHERLADGAVATFPREVGFDTKEQMLSHLERFRSRT